MLNEELLLHYDELYKHNCNLSSIDKTNIICEKNSVILSRLYMASQFDMNTFVNNTIYIRKNEFDKMWKFYKDVAIKHNLRPSVINPNLIYNVSFSRMIKSHNGSFVLEG